MNKILIVFLSFCSIAQADICMDAVMNIESSGNPNAISFLGAKYGRGLYQISEIALKDYNNYHTNERYGVQDLFNTQINGKIASWLLYERIPQLLRFYGHAVNDENVLHCYNIGIGAFNNGKRNINYINKYRGQLCRYSKFSKN